MLELDSTPTILGAENIGQVTRYSENHFTRSGSNVQHVNVIFLGGDLTVHGHLQCEPQGLRIRRRLCLLGRCQKIEFMYAAPIVILNSGFMRTGGFD